MSAATPTATPLKVWDTAPDVEPIPPEIPPTTPVSLSLVSDPALPTTWAVVVGNAVTDTEVVEIFEVVVGRIVEETLVVETLVEVEEALLLDL